MKSKLIYPKSERCLMFNNIRKDNIRIKKIRSLAENKNLLSVLSIYLPSIKSFVTDLILN